MSSSSLIPFDLLNNNLFSLQLAPGNQDTEITMSLKTSEVTTSDLPETVSLLENHLPSIFYSKCYNPENLPFAIEVMQTEVGHLFEHILLEYLSEESIAIYRNRVIFKGETTWNWQKENRGIFRINLSVGGKDINIFVNALEKSILLLNEILKSAKTID